MTRGWSLLADKRNRPPNSLHLSFLYMSPSWWGKSAPSLECVCAQPCQTLWPKEPQPTRFLCPWDSPGKNTGAGCHSLLRGVFLTQGSNPHLLRWEVDSLPLSHLGSPPFLEQTANRRTMSSKRFTAISIIKSEDRAPKCFHLATVRNISGLLSQMGGECGLWLSRWYLSGHRAGFLVHVSAAARTSQICRDCLRVPSPGFGGWGEGRELFLWMHKSPSLGLKVVCSYLGWELTPAGPRHHSPSPHGCICERQEWLYLEGFLFT